MSETPLLDWTGNVQRNYKRPGTSASAAAYAARYAKGTFLEIRTALLHEPGTPDELAARTGINFLTTRPRCSDLRNPTDDLGRPIAPFVLPTGIKRPNNSGRDADVLRLATPTERKNWKP